MHLRLRISPPSSRKCTHFLPMRKKKEEKYAFKSLKSIEWPLAILCVNTISCTKLREEFVAIYQFHSSSLKMLQPFIDNVIHLFVRVCIRRRG